MGTTAVLAIAAIGGAAVASTTAKAPDVNVEAPKQTAPKSDPNADALAAQGAADLQKKRAAAAASQSSTILTGPGGLGELSPEQKGTKQLLGY